MHNRRGFAGELYTAAPVTKGMFYQALFIEGEAVAFPIHIFAQRAELGIYIRLIRLGFYRLMFYFNSKG